MVKLLEDIAWSAGVVTGNIGAILLVDMYARGAGYTHDLQWLLTACMMLPFGIIGGYVVGKPIEQIVQYYSKSRSPQPI